jgi:hypothetical protein
VLTPLNRTGDVQGCQLNRDTHEVKTPDGFKVCPTSSTNACMKCSTVPTRHGRCTPA